MSGRTKRKMKNNKKQWKSKLDAMRVLEKESVHIVVCVCCVIDVCVCCVIGGLR